MANTDPTHEPNYEEHTDPGGVYDDASSGGRTPTGGRAKPDDLRTRESRAAGGGQQQSAGEQAERDQLGKGYTGSKGGGDKKGGSRLGNKLAGAFKGLSKRKKISAWMGIIGAVTGMFAGGFSLFNLTNIFQLDHMLTNIERKGFLRYQVDMENRSPKWINAYLMLRLNEVEDPSLQPKDRDNLLFRGDISRINPLMDPALYTWYKLLRTSSFEEELFQQHGIKFASIGCKGTIVGNECKPGGNVVRYRTAVITIRGAADVPNFQPTAAEIDALQRGDINGFNNRLRDFIDVEILENDRVARERLEAAFHSLMKDESAMKRYFIRKSIQNMTGIRDWRLLENARSPRILAGFKLMTAQEYDEWKRGIQNKFIVKTFPETMKGGKYIQCFFGITTCKKTTTDPSNPENKSTLAPLPEECNQNPECKTSIVDDEGNSVEIDQEASEGLKEGVDGSAGGDTSKSVTKKIMNQLLTKLAGPLSVVSALEIANQLDQQVDDGTLSTMVYNARSQQAQGLFATAGIMRDQMKTGDVGSAEEVDAVMEMFEGGGNSEGWETVIASGDSSLVSAAEFENAKNRAEYCGPAHQEMMIQPEHREAAKKEIALLCEHEKIGGDNLAKDIEDGWQKYIGVILDPIMLVYRGSGLATVMGWFNSAVDAVFEHTIGPLVKGILDATGLSDKIQDLVAWLTTKMAVVLGAGPALSENSPPGVLVNHLIMGASAAAEAAARNQGAAVTNAQSGRRSDEAVMAHLNKERQTQSMHERYLSLENPQSALGKGFFAIATDGWTKTFTSTLGSIFNGSLFANKTFAATEDGRAAANFAGVKMYDFPSVCINTHPFNFTPQNATNADDLGLIPANELTWDLLRVSDAWYARLYQGDDYDGDKIDKVYNCKLLESSMGGAMGAGFNEKTLDENAYGYGFTRGAANKGVPTGTAYVLAKQILEHPNITFQKPEQRKAMEYIAANGSAETCGKHVISPNVLGVVLAVAQEYQLVLGVLTDGHKCDDSAHAKGLAVDIMGVNLLDVSGGTGNNMTWSADQMGVIQPFYNMVAQRVQQAGGGHLGQVSCFKNGVKPLVVEGVKFIDDTCDRIHVDTVR
jgi:hypothetical protein